jgi:hypothetical protein
MKKILNFFNDLVEAWKEAKEWQSKHIGYSSHWE